jgi:hypothetical protein
VLLLPSFEVSWFEDFLALQNANVEVIAKVFTNVANFIFFEGVLVFEKEDFVNNEKTTIVVD